MLATLAMLAMPVAPSNAQVLGTIGPYPTGGARQVVRSKLGNQKQKCLLLQGFRIGVDYLDLMSLYYANAGILGKV